MPGSRAAWRIALLSGLALAQPLRASGAELISVTGEVSQSSFEHDEEVLLKMRACFPGTGGVIFIYPQPCDPPELELLNEANQVVAYLKCDGQSRDVKFVVGEKCGDRTFVWKQTSGRFGEPGLPLGHVVPRGRYTARFNTSLSPTPVLTPTFTLAGSVPLLRGGGLLVLSLTLLLSGILWISRARPVA